jgi:hypothetical protein
MEQIHKNQKIWFLSRKMLLQMFKIFKVECLVDYFGGEINTHKENYTDDRKPVQHGFGHLF